MKKTLFIPTFFLILCCFCSGLSVSARVDNSVLEERVSYSYNYDVSGKAIITPPFYQSTGEIKGDFSTATDMMIVNDNLYVLTAHGIDTYSMEKQTRLNTILSDSVDFTDARGLFVDKNGDVYITQYEKQSVVKINAQGKKLMDFGAPKSDSISNDFVYKPLRIAVQETGLIYVVSEGLYDGLIQFDPEGNYIGFFGANKVTMTAKLLTEQLWNKFRTEEQKKRTTMAIPTNYSSLCLGKNDLVYVCSDSQDLESSQIKKLSPYGNDISPTTYSNTFGDPMLENKSPNVFSDLAVSDNGTITVLDGLNGKVFQYDSVHHLLGVFGGISNQKGTFKSPVAVELYGDHVLVLDTGNNAVAIFAPTAYGDLLRKGSSLYLNGRIQEASEYFEKINKVTGNLAWILSGLGQAALERGDYKAGMQYFKAAVDTEGYNQCFEAYRSGIISKYFWVFFLMIAVLFVFAWIFMSRAIKKDEDTVYVLDKGKLKPWDVLAHPTCFSEIKEFNRGSKPVAITVFVMALFTRLLGLSSKGFLFNTDGGLSKNYISETIQFCLICICFVLCVWAVGTFIEGKGKIADLCMAYAYSLTPFVLCGILSVLLSNVLSLREAVFVTGIEAIGILWTALLVFIATLQINDYSFGKNVISLILTLLAIVFVLFVLVLMATLIGKLSSFVSQVVEEIQFKM